MISQTCKTAIKAVIYLSCHSTCEEKIGIKEIASKIEASAHTVGKILQLLAKHKIVNSLKGPLGGFYLDEGQKSQPIYNIVETIDGPNVFNECGLGLSNCSSSHPCPIHQDYKEARDSIEKIFQNRKIKDLCERVEDGKAYLVSN